MTTMTMTPRLRKVAFLMHVTFSVGWLGSVVAYLALAVGGLTGRDAMLARSAYISMEFIGWAVIVPFSLATLLSGLVQSLGTDWGLFRHYWITVKFFLASAGSLILLFHMRVVGQMSGVAKTTSLDIGNFGGLRIQLVVHAVGGLFLLIAATVLSIYKPWGMTPYGRLKQQEKPVSALDQDTKSIPGSHRKLYVLLGIIGLILLFLILHHLSGGGPRHH
jgi:hypothetical protein